MEPTNWAPEHSAALRDCLAGGMSYAEIARTINAKFNTVYSRSAVLGRARRMGLPGTECTGGSGQPSKSQQMGLHHLRERFVSVARWFVPVFERVELPKLRCVEIEPRHLSLIELEPGDCRYPYGGDEEGEPITFCGHPRRENSSYCTAHFHLTCGPDALSERCVGPASFGIVGEGGVTRTDAGRHDDGTAEAVVAPAKPAIPINAELAADVARQSS